MTSCDPTAAFPGDPRDRVALLSDAASALSAALDVEAVMRALARAFVPAVCDGFEVALRAPDGTLQRIVLGADGIPGWRQREAVPVPELEIHPVRQALRTLRPMVISLADPEQEILFGDPHDPTSARALGITQAIVAPMLGRSAAAGTVAVGIGPSGRTFLEGDAGLIASIARLAGLALENLEAKEQQARTTAMLERAAAVSFAMATAGGEEAVTQAAVALAREELGAATGFVYLLDRAASKLRLAGFAGYEERVLSNWRMIDLQANIPVADVCRQCKPMVVETRQALAERYPELAADAAYFDQAFVAAPIMVGKEAFGAVYWGFDRARRLGQGECRFSEVVAEQCAAGIIRARAEVARAAAMKQLQAQADELFSIAATLQASMLPARLPEVPGVDLAAYHWPGGAVRGGGPQVSGDFYDVFPTGDGRFGILVGDVCGKGVEAAVVTSIARHTARAAALHLDDPVGVLRWVHDALAAEREGRLCTAAYGILQPGTTGGVSLSLSLGGHPQPILVRRGAARPVGVPGMLLGAFEPKLAPAEVPLEVGDLVAFYTDGITDAPSSQNLSEEQLSDLLVHHCDRPLDEVAGELRRELDRRRRVEYDDTALLLMRVTG